MLALAVQVGELRLYRLELVGVLAVLAVLRRVLDEFPKRVRLDLDLLFESGGLQVLSGIVLLLRKHYQRFGQRLVVLCCFRCG